MITVDIPIQQLPHGKELPLPRYMTAGSAGLDLMAAVADPLTLQPGEYLAVPTGIAIALPPGYEGMIRPRSGLALRHGVTQLNAPGTIDSDYRGEIKVIMINHGREPFVIQRGDRIAQLVINQVARAEWVVSNNLDTTDRGDGGFGHTGGCKKSLSLA